MCAPLYYHAEGRFMLVSCETETPELFHHPDIGVIVECLPCQYLVHRNHPFTGLEDVIMTGGAQTYQKFMSHLKILSTTRVTWSKFHFKVPPVLSTTVQNLVATATWNPGFLHLWSQFASWGLCEFFLVRRLRMMPFHGLPSCLWFRMMAPCGIYCNNPE